MEDILISVVVPVYNAIAYLDRCVSSVLKQTYHNIELILVDDGATDGSEKLCDDYAKADSRVKVIHQKNAGVSEARNTGIQAALGEYITFVDSDDWLDEDIYNRVISRKFEEMPDILAYGYYVNDDVRTKDSTNIFVLKENAIYECLTDDEKSVFCGAVWNKLFKASTLKQYLLFNPEIVMAEDMLVVVGCIVHANSIFACYEPGYHYIQRDDSMVHSYKKGKASTVIAHRKIYALLRDEYLELAQLARKRSAEQSFAILLEALSAKLYEKHDVDLLGRDLRCNAKLMEKNKMTKVERLLCFIVRMPGGCRFLHTIMRFRKGE